MEKDIEDKIKNEVVNQVDCVYKIEVEPTAPGYFVTIWQCVYDAEYDCANVEFYGTAVFNKHGNMI